MGRKLGERDDHGTLSLALVRGGGPEEQWVLESENYLGRFGVPGDRVERVRG